MPPTMSVTVGRPEAELTFDPVAVELLELLGVLELPHAARTAASAATLAALMIFMGVRVEERLNMATPAGVGVGEGGCAFRRSRLRSARAAARTGGAVPAGRSGPLR